jgi:hypothetical protein
METIVQDYEKQSSFRAEVIRYVCNTPDEVVNDL